MNKGNGRQRLHSVDDCLDQTMLLGLLELGGPDFVGEMIDLFLEDAPKRVEAARAAEKGGELEALRHAVHPLKSSAGSFGAHALAEVAAKIERLALEKKADTISALVSDLEEKFVLVRARLREEKMALHPECSLLCA